MSLRFPRVLPFDFSEIPKGFLTCSLNSDSKKDFLAFLFMLRGLLDLFFKFDTISRESLSYLLDSEGDLLDFSPNSSRV